MPRDTEETKRWGLTTKAAVAIATVLVTAAGAGIGGGAYTARHNMLTEDRVAEVVRATVQEEMEKFRLVHEMKMGEMKERASKNESLVAMIQSEMLPRLTRLEEQTGKTANDVAYIRGLLERKQ